MSAFMSLLDKIILPDYKVQCGNTDVLWSKEIVEVKEKEKIDTNM
jgi:hypothetical protein